jgi:cytochrome c biogenesis protein CcdA
MISKSNLHEAQSNFFNLFIYISYALLFISALGISQKAPKYLDYMEYYIRIYICLFLMWRFNPLREKYEFTELDRKIAFSAGLFILTTTALNQYIEELKKIFQNLV